ncbi:uncharacterized protein [Heptranchias perlo]|uniref:uncharacterized protein n=1 Tax=Heptranchias perlo TaxID=212740 RepID=UPI0035594888
MRHHMQASKSLKKRQLAYQPSWKVTNYCHRTVTLKNTRSKLSFNSALTSVTPTFLREHRVYACADFGRELFVRLLVCSSDVCFEQQSTDWQNEQLTIFLSISVTDQTKDMSFYFTLTRVCCRNRRNQVQQDNQQCFITTRTGQEESNPGVLSAFAPREKCNLGANKLHDFTDRGILGANVEVTSSKVEQFPKHVNVARGANVSLFCTFPLFQDAPDVVWWRRGENKFLEPDNISPTPLEIAPIEGILPASLKLECKTAAFYPEHLGISWRRDGVEILTGIETVKNRTAKGLYEVSSFLEEVQPARSGVVYTCLVSHVSLVVPAGVSYTVKGHSLSISLIMIVRLLLAFLVILALTGIIVDHVKISSIEGKGRLTISVSAAHNSSRAYH